MRGRNGLFLLGITLSLLIILGLYYSQKAQKGPEGVPDAKNDAQNTPAYASTLPSTLASAAAAGSPIPTITQSSNPQLTPSPGAPDLTVDAEGLSKATVVLNTTEGVIKFKFYSQDAPNTVKRIAELIQKGFYNGLTFHRVVPGFVIQGGDPTGTGAGGSGQKLKAEFNNRHHVEGTVAMARANDPDSADSQFYISLGTLPHLDNKYTIFGQVIEGMDVARKIKVGDKMNTVVLQ